MREEKARRARIHLVLVFLAAFAALLYGYECGIAGKKYIVMR